MSEPMPPLLMIEQMTNSGATSQGAERSALTSINKIEQQLKINDTNYVLVEVILCDGGHFRGITNIHGKYLLYDGMFSSNRLRWTQPHSKFSSGNDDYYVTCLWYRKCHNRKDDDEQQKVIDGNSDCTEPTEEQNNETTSPGKSTPSSDDDIQKQVIANALKSMNEFENTYTQKTKSNGGKPVRKKPMKVRSPMGLSINPVLGKGKQPICKYCYGKISRGEWHTIKRTKHPDITKNWGQLAHYHFGCFQHLSHKEQDQLVAILKRSPEIDEDLKKQIDDDVKCHREK